MILAFLLNGPLRYLRLPALWDALLWWLVEPARSSFTESQR
jgi:hypothetical protein